MRIQEEISKRKNRIKEIEKEIKDLEDMAKTDLTGKWIRDVNKDGANEAFYYIKSYKDKGKTKYSAQAFKFYWFSDSVDFSSYSIGLTDLPKEYEIIDEEYVKTFFNNYMLSTIGDAYKQD